jgi:DMSO/TMAO reductase YedYZ molybdopterin-dependent catalytic subunit
MEKWIIKLHNQGIPVAELTMEDFEQYKDDQIPIQMYVSKKQGEAVLFRKLLALFFPPQPYTHAKFIASDGYSQTIPTDDLQHAFLLFKQAGAPLQKGYPIRLYVPSGDTDCLNVKSVIEIEMLINR